MEYHLFRDWPKGGPEAFSIVSELAPRLQFEPLAGAPKTIAAVDTAYGVEGAILYAGAVVMSFPDGVEIERAFFHGPVLFPYIPGLFFFREGQIIVETLARLKTNVDLIMLSGHGRAHPRSCGMACHIGYIFDKPSIGCARKLLSGTHRPISSTAGSSEAIMLNGKEVGLVYRSKENVKPIFISPGHKCDLASARDIVLQSLHGYRLPEQLRVAHLLANRYRQRAERENPLPTSDGENE